MKETKKIKNKGFTLVELLITIGIIGIILTISTASVFTIINNSKNNSNKIAINNMKKSAGLYEKEYKKEITWDENNETCIPLQTLVSKGYLKKELLNNNDIPLSIILKRDEYNNIISEKTVKEDCDTYSRTVPMPKNEEICINYTYDGKSHNLINNTNPNYKSIQYTDINDHPINAGSYKVAVELIDNKQWEDNTKDKKIVTCQINKKTPNLTLDHQGNSSTKLGTTTITLSSDVKGEITIKSSSKKHLTAKVVGEKNINANGSKEIEITTLAQREGNTIVTITVTPTEEFAKNYTKASITYTVGPITNITINKPTCNDLYYNTKEQTLAKTSNFYQMINNKATEIGKYTVTARLKYGYIWNDNSIDDVKVICEIKTPTPTVTYKDANCTPASITVTYNRPYGENQNLCTPTKNGYEFNGWYNNNSYTTKITNDTKVTNFNNHNIYAKWNANTYKIKYHGNGNTGGSMADSTHTYDIPKKLSANKFTKTGYGFVNWNTKADGTGTIYTEEANVSNLTTKKDETINLYAQWKALSYDAKKEETTYTATASCTNGRVLSNGNCIYETTCEEDCLGWRCDTGCGMCYTCPDDPSEVCGCEDDGGKWIEYETTCDVPCSKTQNEYRKYTCPKGGTLSGTTCTLITYSCPDGGTLNGTTCTFE